MSKHIKYKDMTPLQKEAVYNFFKARNFPKLVLSKITCECGYSWNTPLNVEDIIPHFKCSNCGKDNTEE